MFKACLVALGCMTLTPLAYADAPLRRVQDAVPGRYIVLLTADTTAVQSAAALAREAHGRIVHEYATVLNGFSIQAPEQAVLALAKRREVEAIWEVPFVHTDDTQYGAPDNLDRIDQRALPLNDSYLFSAYTAGVTIYIADTGIDPRSEFGSRLTANINFSSDASGYRDPGNYTDYGLPLNDAYHGTSSAVVAAGATYGVAKWVKIANVRVISGVGAGTYDDVVAGVQWITAQRTARPSEYHIGNASFGGSFVYEPAETAFRQSIAAGVAWIFSAGNDGTDACNHSPGRLGSLLSGAITVGASNPANDGVYNFSNQGPCVEIFAPGAADWGSATGQYGGTSAAAPHVAGVFAIRWALSPLASAGEIEGLIKGLATEGVLSNIWPTSPNLLLYSLNSKRRSAGS